MKSNLLLTRFSRQGRGPILRLDDGRKIPPTPMTVLRSQHNASTQDPNGRADGIVALAVAACGGSSSSSSSSSASAASSDRSAAASSGGATDASAAPGGGSAGTLTIWADDLLRAGHQDGQRPVRHGLRRHRQRGDRFQGSARAIRHRFAGRNWPDLVIGAHDWIGNFVQNGAIDPIPMTDATKKLFQTPAIQAVTFNSRIYGVPFALENIALYRNTDLARPRPDRSRQPEKNCRPTQSNCNPRASSVNCWR